MPAWLTFDRILLALVLAVVLWDAQAARADRRAAEQLAAHVAELQEITAKVGEDLATQEPCPACPVCEAPRAAEVATPGHEPTSLPGGADPRAAGEPRPADAPRGRVAFKDRKRLADMPGNVLNRLYDATDRMADDEQWDDATYDQVTAVFEESAARATELLAGMRDGSVNEAQAREAAVALRDETTERLQTVIGPDGLQRLKTYMGKR